VAPIGRGLRGGRGFGLRPRSLSRAVGTGTSLACIRCSSSASPLDFCFPEHHLHIQVNMTVSRTDSGPHSANYMHMQLISQPVIGDRYPHTMQGDSRSQFQPIYPTTF